MGFFCIVSQQKVEHNLTLVAHPVGTPPYLVKPQDMVFLEISLSDLTGNEKASSPRSRVSCSKRDQNA
jgi:hypothetical protein